MNTFLDLSVSYMYLVYEGAFNGLTLDQLDKKVYSLLPLELIKQTNCDHCFTCQHNLAWKAYCIHVCDFIVQAANTVNFIPEKDLKQCDLLTLMVIFATHTNIVIVIDKIFQKMSLSKLLNVCNKSNEYKIYCKYIKNNKEYNVDELRY